MTRRSISRSKYGAKKAVVDGIKFDSLKESRRYLELKILLRAGEIAGLELQPRYDLMVREDAPVKSRTDRYPGGRVVFYKADFRYKKDGALVVEDVKGMDTPASRIKRAVVEAYYGIEIILI